MFTNNDSKLGRHLERMIWMKLLESRPWKPTLYQLFFMVTLWEWKIIILWLGKWTISMAMFNSELLNCQRVLWDMGLSWTIMGWLDDLWKTAISGHSCTLCREPSDAWDCPNQVTTTEIRCFVRTAIQNSESWHILKHVDGWEYCQANIVTQMIFETWGLQHTTWSF